MKDIKDFIKPALVLMIITTIAAAALSYTYHITEPKIEEQRQKAIDEALAKVMPGADRFEKHKKYWVAYADDEVIGRIAIAKGNGYSSTIETIIGVDNNDEITGIYILDQLETPGLGARITESRFREQFKGKTLDQIDEVDGITGATVSSDAVKGSVKWTFNKLVEVDAVTGATK